MSQTRPDVVWPGGVIDSTGLIVTNAHVVSGRSGRGKGSNLRVTLNNSETYSAQLLAKDSDHDVSALKIEADGLIPIELGDSQTLRPGQWVLAMGHPWGVTGAAAGGMVIGSGGDLPERPGSRDDWIAVGLSLRPGHSGGPMVDAEGWMVGLNTMMAGLGRRHGGSGPDRQGVLGQSQAMEPGTGGSCTGLVAQTETASWNSPFRFHIAITPPTPEPQRPFAFPGFGLFSLPDPNARVRPRCR